MGCCNKRCALITGAVIGAVLALLGGILIPVGNILIEETVLQEALIAPGSPAYDNWLSPGGAVYRQFWFFDVQNAREVEEEGAAPLVAEKGPYTYLTRYSSKANITFNPNNTVSYLLPLGAVFEPSLSVGPEEDVITSLNLAVAGAYSKIPIGLHPLLETMIKSSNSSLFQLRSVNELLWGYKDPMLKATVGLFVPYNGTFDGHYTVFTGEGDISKVGMIDMWRGSRSLPFWGDKYCNMINGTDGSNFAPFVDATKPIFFFSSDICRSVSANFEYSTELKKIPVYRFGLLPSTLASPVDNPDNRCYCRDPKTTKNCTIAGVLDISSCQDGQPVYISLPHFLHGTPSLHQAIKGLNPIEEHHKTYLDVEPITGITLGFAKRIQVNMMYGPSNVITVLKKIKENIIFPVVWMNETAELGDESASLLKEELVERIQMLDVIQKVLLGSGLAVFAFCLVLYAAIGCDHNKSETV
ncbi:platelet glycoprotein 4 [Festucalex cinctus]